ncbi:Putative prophage LambdaSo, minor tail protein M [Vibrio cholerae]|uniref:Phage-related protein n=1 Tax=Vibrio diazotrophicus TaxID=685 RepID=A0A329E9Z6_VIBDI|nr:phage tail protein [Vibrio diazotrophicus]RAS62626.1 phage-related protein [Vibrio diazotrophicus]GHZ69281.1 Putative prophage LambdaSo, minor tail protein M [Vibrio cholerae]
MPQVFEWAPLIEFAGSSSFRTLSAQFGDGYAQEVGDGINTKSDSYSLQFKGDYIKIKAIMDFIDEHKGYVPFYWSPNDYGDEMLLWVCAGYSKNNITHGKDAGLWSLSCTFNQRFNP